MIKYRGRFRLYMPIDQNTGGTTSNEDDTYLRCIGSKAYIHRFNEDTLVLYLNGTEYANNRAKKLKALGVELKMFQDCNGERTYLFAEKDLDKVATVVQPVTQGKNKSPRKLPKRDKKVLTVEEQQIVNKRMAKLREAQKEAKNID